MRRDINGNQLPGQAFYAPGTSPARGTAGISLSHNESVLTPGATRRRAIGQVLLLAAGLVVLTIISAGSVYLVNQAREDARWVLHTVEVENQISVTQLQLRRAESAQRSYISTLLPAFLTDFENAASQLTPDLMQLRRLTNDNPVQG